MACQKIRCSLIWLLGALFAACGQPSGTGSSAPSVPAFTIRIGATCSRSGALEQQSRPIDRALTLFQDVLNMKFPFKTNIGENISVKLTVLDDESNSVMVHQLYSQMVVSNDFDIFLGPCSSAMSAVAANVTDSANKILMLHQAVMPWILKTANGDPRFDYVFSTHPKLADYFNDGLQRLWSEGARTMVVTRGLDDLHDVLCDGATAYGSSIGFNILADFLLSSSEQLTHQIRQIRAFDPDVFVTCADLKDEILLTLTSRALMFNPKSLLLSQAANQSFIDAVGAINSHYLLGPVPWSKGVDGSGRVFSSSQEFHQLYVTRWNVAPDSNAALAAAAAVAAMAASEIVGTPGPTSQALKSALRNNNIQTFAALLQFNVSGQRLGMAGHTQQIWPDQSAVTPAQLYTQTVMRVLSQTFRPRYPAPTWLQRELEVYPCDAGKVRDRFSPNVDDCVLCPAGTARSNDSLLCRACDGQSYSNMPGMSRCTPCEEGMDCSANHSIPITARGYYQLQDKSGVTHFLKCDPPELCTGANTCAGANKGVMCDLCPRGYMNKGWGSLGAIRGLCMECPGWAGNLLWFIGLLGIYAAFIVVLSLSDHASSHSFAALHGVVFKIVINYSQFMSTMVTASDMDLVHNFHALRSIWEMILNPLQYMLSFECAAASMGFRRDKADVIIGMLVLPVGLIVSWVMFSCFTVVMVRKVRWRTTKIDRFAGGIPSIFEVTSMSSLGKTATAMHKGRTTSSINLAQELPAHSELPLELSQDCETELSDVSDECSDTGTTVDAAAVNRADSPVAVASSTSDFEGETRVVVSAGTVDVSQITRRLNRLRTALNPPVEVEVKHHLGILWTRTAVISVYILHPIAMQMCLSGIYCKQMGDMRLRRHLDTLCNEGEQRLWFALSIFGILSYGLGVPFVIGRLLFRLRHQLLHVKVRRKYGFLYNGFELTYYNFEVWYMVRKFMLISAAAIPDAYLRTLGMSWLACIFLAVQIIFRPWDNRGYFVFDTLETLSLVSLIATLLLRLGLELRSDLEGGTFKFVERTEFEIACVLVVGYIHFSFFVLAIWSLIRNTYVRKLLFERECVPENLSAFQNFLCNIAESRSHRMQRNSKTHCLEIKDLTCAERHLLQTCLSDTLGHYFVAEETGVRANVEGAIFHIDLLSCGIREAFRRCERTRRNKVRRFIIKHKELLKSREGINTKGRFQWLAKLGPDADPAMLDKAARHFARTSGVTVEELQVALMICWPDIVAGHQRYYQMVSNEDLETALNQEALHTDLIYDDTKSMTQMLDIMSRRNRCNLTFSAVLDRIFDAENNAEQDVSPKELPTREARNADKKNTFQQLGLHVARDDEHYLDTFSGTLRRPQLEKEHRILFEEMIEMRNKLTLMKSKCRALAFNKDFIRNAGVPYSASSAADTISPSQELCSSERVSDASTTPEVSAAVPLSMIEEGPLASTLFKAEVTPSLPQEQTLEASVLQQETSSSPSPPLVHDGLPRQPFQKTVEAASPHASHSQQKSNSRSPPILDHYGLPLQPSQQTLEANPSAEQKWPEGKAAPNDSGDPDFSRVWWPWDANGVAKDESRRNGSTIDQEAFESTGTQCSVGHEVVSSPGATACDSPNLPEPSPLSGALIPAGNSLWDPLPDLTMMDTATGVTEI